MEFSTVYDFAITKCSSLKILSSGRVEHKIQLLGSMFPEKIEFDGKKYRTNSYNKVLEWIFLNTNELKQKETEDSDKISDSSVSVPGAGVEPARPQWPQDFKSCVSTNSTIRASTNY